MDIFLMAVVIALQFVDAWSTWQVIRFGVGYEANPVMGWLMERLGNFWGLFVGKAWAIAVVVSMHPWWGSMEGMAVLALVAGFYVLVVVNNLRILYGDHRA